MVKAPKTPTLDYNGVAVPEWSTNHVHAWLNDAGFDHIADEIAFEQQIDGTVLLHLTESDLREPPLSLRRLGDIKKLANAIRQLKTSLALNPVELCESMSDLSASTSAIDSSLAVAANGEPIVPKGLQKLHKISQLSSSSKTDSGTRLFQLITREEWIKRVEAPDTKAKSLLKLGLAFCYCLISLLITAFVMVLVHDRVPDMKTYPPLPDLVLDNLPLIPWAFECCEMIAVAMAIIWFTVLFFHKERVVIMRRMFSLVGTVFLLRCVTMLITSLSVPGVHLACRAKSYGNLAAKLTQAFNIWSKLGMSIQGVRTCGDYMFSGHTTVITLLNHFITEYTPQSWHALHTATWIMNFFGIFFILAGHEHYSIDVFIAFYISSRMFLYYHTYAYNHSNLTTNDSRMRLWFPLGWFFEAGGVGRVENEFDLPFPTHFGAEGANSEETNSDADSGGALMMKTKLCASTSDGNEACQENTILTNNSSSASKSTGPRVNGKATNRKGR
uniref:SAM domain-containing protein n=1 Tax=Panagrellus redivivus TaxID=6233 RepID=A0A7E4UVG7_PANRE